MQRSGGRGGAVRSEQSFGARRRQRVLVVLREELTALVCVIVVRVLRVVAAIALGLRGERARRAQRAPDDRTGRNHVAVRFHEVFGQLRAAQDDRARLDDVFDVQQERVELQNSDFNRQNLRETDSPVARCF